MTPKQENIDEVLKRALSSASTEEMESARVRIFNRLKTDDDGRVKHSLGKVDSLRGARWRGVVSIGAVAAAVAAAMWIGVNTHRNDSVYAVLQTGEGALYRVDDGKPVPVRSGQRIGAQEIVRTNEGGGIIALADGSRVEMRAQSEISLERADDGIRIHLRQGDLLVHAAKQVAGHLYVQTRDVTVSVVGTVFLVNAEEEGSRVAVIEGEVHVQHGATSKNLLPGEEVSTNPSLKWLPVHEELSRTRTETHLAALQQPAVVPAETREVFEVASVRPTRFSGGGVRGDGGGGQTSIRPAIDPCGDHPNSFFLKFDPGRALISDMPVYGLIAWAYGLACSPLKGSYFILGGPGWIKSDGYDIEALTPPGDPAFTSAAQDTRFGAPPTRQTMTPRFRKMLQSLLEDRFKLVVKHETRAVPVYALSVAKGGSKLTTWKEGDPATMNEFIVKLGLPASEREAAQQAQSLGQQDRAYLNGLKAPMSVLVSQIKNATDRPIVDRTGITEGLFNYRIGFSRLLPPYRATPGADNGTTPSAPSLFTALEEEVGLKLEATTAPMEVWVIEHVERPSEN